MREAKLASIFTFSKVSDLFSENTPECTNKFNEMNLQLIIQ